MKNLSFIIICLITLYSCSSENENRNHNITLNFSHSWDGSPVNNSDFNEIKFTNAYGNQLSIERLRYVISDIAFTNTNKEITTIEEHNLVDVTNNTNLSFSPTSTIPHGTYTNVSFVFGLINEKNSNITYQDLNSANFGVPTMMGGGYHYMQLDGKFVNNTSLEQGFNYHAIRAVNNSGVNPNFPQDTFFKVNLGSVTINKDTSFNIEMNIAQWFKSPHTWNLNILNQSLMPNSAAQIMMYDNGQNVFSLTSID